MKTFTALTQPVLLAFIARHGSLTPTRCNCGANLEVGPPLDANGNPVDAEKYFESIGLVRLTPEIMAAIFNGEGPGGPVNTDEVDDENFTIKTPGAFIMPPSGTLQ